MERSTSRNARLAASTGPPKRPTQVAGHVGISMGTPGVVQDVTDPEATTSQSLGRSKEDTTGFPANTGEPVARRQQRMDWKEKSRFPSKQQWKASSTSGDQFVVHTTKHTTKRVVKQLGCIYGRKLGWHNCLYWLWVEFLANGEVVEYWNGEEHDHKQILPLQQPH